ncbi:protein of unknown function [Mariniphaga anaerophila]|uniref:DUF4855 domain-containing protein n=1 Tax=Mariniphaga anaerophila TaxID=1484053 RepID=A0A1M5AM53_9BACT|nr:DUF4855 domain-containing protein [Mariniphaga anaerophila]SHF31313.1 protein of unknown function [Mariniphaga anaerophila]
MRHLQKTFILSVLLASLTLSLAACSHKNEQNTDDEELIFKDEPVDRELKYYNAVPHDMVLIYDGGAHRNVQWNKEHFAPYISAESDGREQWLFDGFLFLEIKDGQGRGFASGYEKLAARKVEWKNLLENYFAKGNGINALNEQLAEVRNSGRISGNYEKRKIVLTVPEPIPNQTDWGQLDGRSLRFSNRQDRLDACKWYIDYAEELFRKANFENVELIGFYWLAEEATNSRTLASDVADYLYEKEYDFYWIPYFNSDGYSEWKNLGFNVPYYQPNYFFSENTPYSRLQEACDRAKKFHMNMEVEFDDRALKGNKNWGYRLKDYLDVYEKNGVYDSLKVAYYQGGDSFYKLSKSENDEDSALYRRLTKLIIQRGQNAN